MRTRGLIWVGVIFLITTVVLFWRRDNRPITGPEDSPAGPVAASRVAATNQSTVVESLTPAFLAGEKSNSIAKPKTNHLDARFANTTKTAGKLLRDDNAILLENALIDTSKELGFSIPEHLRVSGDHGSYIVQARGPLTDSFRSALTAAGATIVSYIPNNAYLVRMSADAAKQLTAAAQSVLPYEPVYKLKAELLSLGLAEAPLPPGSVLNVLAFPDARLELLTLLKDRRTTVLGEGTSPFGAVFTIKPDANWTVWPKMSAVQMIELARPRVAANDQTRVRVGVAPDSLTETNYLGLTGSNVLVSLNDTGVDANHPDLVGRVFANDPFSLTDANGHGTHVAGIIAGSGLTSTNVQFARGSIYPATNFQFRGIAPAAKLFVQSLGLGIGPSADGILQASAARTNALISNNSWHYSGDNSYSIAASSFDAAVRDAIPGATGSQPVLFVFPAGNAGGGINDSGLSGEPQSILSPATSKNGITVGALELSRDITNSVWKCSPCATCTNGVSCITNQPWKGMTSSENEVARFSSRGNVGIGIEGDFGRFKPDVVAPGTFVISTRSTTWDEYTYYNPTSHHVVTYEAQIVGSNSFAYYDVFLPDNAVGFTLNVVNITNTATGVRYAPGLPVYVSKVDYPTTTPPFFDFFRTNSVSVPPDGGGIGSAVNQSWYYGIRNTTSNTFRFDLVADVITTNDFGNYLEVLSNLNNTISANPTVTNGTAAPTNFYRYESGTSMAAGSVSGMLALMQEFFQKNKNVTNSPALMKALLINGARLAGGIYDFQVANTINYQGWGVAQLPNSIHVGLTNSRPLNTSSNSVFLFDQSPTNALATGQSQTRFFSVSDAGRTLPLRVTLVWTDPPGNPTAGIKLVNDLDLIVTNRDTGEIYYGNDIPANSLITFASNTNEPPHLDAVNNVENVLLDSGIGTNYSVTVLARRVNVNAVTAHTNNVVQDFALVISSGNGEIPDTLFQSQQPVVSNTSAGIPEITVVANLATNFSPEFATASLTGQRVGANTPLSGTTNGMTNQWHFFIVTNTTTFTNASFFVSDATDLALPRIGVFQAFEPDATRENADVDLYVSEDSNLVQLSPPAILGAGKSLSRNIDNGDEAVIYSNSAPNRVYYVGVKSEDQQAAEFEFFVVFSLLPLGQEGADGFIQAIPVFPADGSTADGSSEKYAVARWRAYVPGGGEVRRVVITNSLYHQAIEELVDAVVSPDQKVVVLNNHTNFTSTLPPGPYNFLYDDSNEGDFIGAIPANGPGQLRDYLGDQRSGLWNFYFVDNVFNQTTGRVAECKIRIERLPEDGQNVTNDIAPNTWKYYARNVPVEATNLTVCLSIISPNPQPLQLYIRKDQLPTPTAFDFTRTINPSGCLTVDKFSLPPLSAGRYFIGVFNTSSNTQTFVYSSTMVLGPPPPPIPFEGVGNQPMLDDAVTNYSTFVTNTARISQLEVGLRIDHPRVSDLAVTLVSPRGTRVLLVENRGGTDPNGFGSSLTLTNFVPVAANGGPAAQTNFIETGSTVGAVTIDYDFLQELDQMTVYYDGIQLTNTGMINGTGRFTLNYGPGTSTIVEVRMNELGNPQTNTLWAYTVSSINQTHSYLVFTENTNRTPLPVPVKFALPPFVGTAGTNFTVSDFEPPVLAQDYTGPTVGNPDGWSVLTNIVTVITNTANTGVQSLSLRSGLITRTLPTTPGRNYRLNFAHREAVSSDDFSWWPGQSASIATEIVSANHGVLQNVTFVPGVVGQAFYFNGTNSSITVPAHPSLDVGLGDGFSIEGWINPSDALQFPIADWTPTNGTYGAHFFASSGGPLTLMANLGDTANNTHVIITAPNTLVAGVFQHVALTFNRLTGEAKLFRNGNLVGQQNLGIFIPNTATPLNIGYRGPATPNGNLRSKGLIDELAIYSRTLADAEIQAIYAAGAAGKCGMVTPPEVCLTRRPGRLIAAFDDGTLADIGFHAPCDPARFATNIATWFTGGQAGRFLAYSTHFGYAGGGLAGAMTAAGHSWTVSTAASFTLTNLLTYDGLFLGGVDPVDTNVVIEYILNGGNVYVFSGGLTEDPRWNPLLGRFGLGFQGTTSGSFDIPIVSPHLVLAGVDHLFGFNGVNNGSAVVDLEPANPRNSVIASYQGAGLFGVWEGSSSPGAQIYVPGRATNSFVGTSTWQLDALIFTATNNTTDILLSPGPSNAVSGVLVDSFTLVEAAGHRYVLPEESLRVLDGEIAYGEWQLEIWDSRAGAANLTSLLGWQLQFLFQTNTAFARPLRPGDPVTTTIFSNSIAIYVVDVPNVARFATNILFGATPGSGLGFYFNQFIPPVFGATNALPFPDTVFAASAINWTEVMGTTGTTTLLLPGQRYYLAVENTNNVAVTYTIMVDFDLVGVPLFVTLTNGIPYCALNAGPSVSLDYYRYVVSSNALRAQFEIINPSGDMTMLLRRDLPPVFNNFDYLSANPFTNSEVITVFDFSQPVALTPGDWYMAAANISGGPVSYCVKATEWPIYGTNIVITNVFLGSNSFCLTWTSLPGVNYYVEGLTDLSSTNWVTASPTITATGPLTTYCVPLPSPLHFFRVREGIALNLYSPPPIISKIRRTFNGIELTWGGPTNAQYQVQWSPLLVPATWTAFTNPPAVSSATGLFRFLDDGSETGGFNGTRFYRLLLLP